MSKQKNFWKVFQLNWQMMTSIGFTIWIKQLCLVWLHFYRPQRSCGQGNIFAPVCHSVHRGVVVSQKALRQTPPGSRHPLGAGSPPPPEQTPAYGLWAAGTHPTGKHSCWILKPQIIMEERNKLNHTKLLEWHFGGAGGFTFTLSLASWYIWCLKNDLFTLQLA